MDIRYSCNQRDFKRYTTEETRNEMLITGLYKADEMVAVYSHVDRMGKSLCFCHTDITDETGRLLVTLRTVMDLTGRPLEL